MSQPKNKKELRPMTIYCNDEEFQLISSLVTMAAAGMLKIDKSWLEVAIPLHERLTRLYVKLIVNKEKQNVQKAQSENVSNV